MQNSLSVDSRSVAVLPFIAADVGGTHARVGWVRPRGSDSPDVELLKVERYACAQWPSLGEILADFRARFPVDGTDTATHAALACAGFLQDDAIANVNLPWPVAIEATRARAGLSRVECINDFEALEVFCALLGSFCADAAIMLRASGGVVLAGGILPHIETFLATSDFAPRFRRTGAMRSFLERVPVRLIDHGDLGIVGAGCWSLGQRR